MDKESGGVLKPASTAQLMASFGWDSDDTLTQQDVGEFVSVFLETVEEKMKDSPVKGEISRLFAYHDW